MRLLNDEGTKQNKIMKLCISKWVASRGIAVGKVTLIQNHRHLNNQLSDYFLSEVVCSIIDKKGPCEVVFCYS